MTTDGRMNIVMIEPKALKREKNNLFLRFKFYKEMLRMGFEPTTFGFLPLWIGVRCSVQVELPELCYSYSKLYYGEL